MNTCEHYRLQISQLLDGELPEAQQQTLRAHLHTCPDCQRVYKDFLTLHGCRAPRRPNGAYHAAGAP